MSPTIQPSHCLNHFAKIGLLTLQATIATMVLNFFATTQLTNMTAERIQPENVQVRHEFQSRYPNATILAENNP